MCETGNGGMLYPLEANHKPSEDPKGTRCSIGLQYETPSSISASFYPLCFTCKSRENEEPTSGLEPLT
jgi:hypothetical protein